MTLTALPSNLAGLTEAEAQARHERGEGNTGSPPTGRTYGQIVRQNVFSFINNAIFLLGIGLVLVGRPTDAVISVGIILTNVVVSVVQEVRAKRMLDRIALLTRATATVVREGVPRAVSPEELVLGDTVQLTPGDQVLVDGVIAEGVLELDESLLSGESDLVRKGLGDQVYSGSSCVTGGGRFTVTRVGLDSFAGKLSVGARAHRRVFTPLQKQINLTIRVLLLMVIYLEILVVANGVIKALPLPEGVQQATVIVGLVPNGLFVAIAVAYALGAVRIARQGALVQQANAVESLSNVDVLCLDKTGTLTTNRLKFEELHCPPEGLGEERVRAAMGAMLASSNARNKTTEALAAAFPGEKAAMAREIPFSSARKWSAVAFDGELRGLYALGAPEMLQPYVEDAWDGLVACVHEWSTKGLRVLLLCYHPDPASLPPGENEAQLPLGMVPAALLCLSDELRSDARATLDSFVASGVTPKIISGDSPETVAALARQAGFLVKGRLISGKDLDELTGGAFTQAALDSSIFGRISPEQKEQLVDALRQRGHYVAMMGDGVNDVLSLKKADLGIAMQSGTQATRAVADIILLNDSFASLAPAVAEGQRIVNGMQDILKLFLTRIAAMSLIILAALVIGVFPVNLRHGSLTTLFTVGIPSVLLAVWARPGRQERHGSLVRRLAHFVVPAALLASLFGLAVFYGTLFLRVPGIGPAEVLVHPLGFRDAVAVGQTSLAAFLVMIGLLLIVFVEPPNHWWTGGDVLSSDRRPSLLAAGLGLAFAALLASPPLRTAFELQVLGWPDLALVGGATLAWLFTVRAAWRHRVLERFFAVQ
jgi:cation-transporting P-type ATPase E